MARRLYCSRCEYPQVTCVCGSVQAIHCHSTIDVLQHPSELSAAKNTLRLAKLCLDSMHVWVGDGHFSTLATSLQNDSRKVIVVYPSEQAVSSQTLFPLDRHQHRHESYRLVLIDGTWKKAYKLWQANPWLKQFPSVVIDGVRSQYRIRKAKQANSLSTLESIAHMLEGLEGLDTSPLYRCLANMQNNFYTPEK